jgi:CMP-N,N'-diacetyllegionaminic acid synthase
MIGGKKVLAVIPARGGSKGLPGKNIKTLGGKPLIAWSIEAARHSAYIDRCIVSTEDDEIARIAREWNGDVPFVRPGHLATDEAFIEDVLIDVLDRLDESYDYLVLLQPTSPLRSASDIDGCVAACNDAGTPVCVTVAPPPKSPYLMYRLEAGSRLVPIMEGRSARRRQELPAIFALNGAVYVASVEWFRRHRNFMSEETVGYAMPAERSVDIDSELDLRFADLLLSNPRAHEAPPSRS